MVRPSDSREDLDALLGALEAPASPPPGDGEPSRASPPAPVAAAPASAGETNRGHTDFSDLFASDKAAPPRGDLDEKIEWFRDRLRRAEAQLARVREAWGTRDAELAAAESELARERAVSESARAQVAAMQRFLEHKKSELVAYGAKVKQALIDKDLRIEVLEQELAEQQEALEAERHDAREQRDRTDAATVEAAQTMEQELASQRQALEAERRDARKQRDRADAAAIQAAATIAKLSDGLRAAVSRWQALAAELDEIDRSLPPPRLGAGFMSDSAAVKGRRAR